MFKLFQNINFFIKIVVHDCYIFMKLNVTLASTGEVLFTPRMTNYHFKPWALKMGDVSIIYEQKNAHTIRFKRYVALVLKYYEPYKMQVHLYLPLCNPTAVLLTLQRESHLLNEIQSIFSRVVSFISNTLLQRNNLIYIEHDYNIPKFNMASRA